MSSKYISLLLFMFELRTGITSVPGIALSPFKMLDGKSETPDISAYFFFFFFFFFFAPKFELVWSGNSSSMSAPISIFGCAFIIVPVIIVSCKFLMGKLVELLVVVIFLSIFDFYIGGNGLIGFHTCFYMSLSISSYGISNFWAVSIITSVGGSCFSSAWSSSFSSLKNSSMRLISRVNNLSFSN